MGTAGRGEGGMNSESSTETYITICETESEGEVDIKHWELNPVFCDNLEGWNRGKREGLYVYLWLIHVVIQQKPTQHCKAIILQLKINLKNN